MSTKKSPSTDSSISTTFIEHIKELRTRVMVVAGIFFILSVVAYYFRDTLIAIVRMPIGDQQLVYLTPAGGFSFIFSVTLYAAMVVTAPFLVYQIYQFVKPALPAAARRYSWQIFIASMVLMLAGVLFGYFFAVPAALKFLNNFAGDLVIPNLTADSYLSFFMAYIVGLGILFQLPLLLLFWNWISPVKPGQLLNSQRYIIGGSFIVAAMITPTPDAFNQAMVAAPIIVIYQFGAVAVILINRKQRKQRVNPSELKKDDEAIATVLAHSSEKTKHLPPRRAMPRQSRIVADIVSTGPQQASLHRQVKKQIAPAARGKRMDFGRQPASRQSTPRVYRALRNTIPDRPASTQVRGRSLDGIM